MVIILDFEQDNYSRNGSESNSTYYSDLDIARTHLISTLLSTGIDCARHEHGNGLLGVRKGSFTIKLGAVRCSFKREIRPYQRYDMWTRVLSWENKWLYTITHFVRWERKNGEEKGRKIVCASAISKCVFKAGRRTIPPAVMLHASGLLPQGMAERSLRPLAEELGTLDGVCTVEGVGMPELDPTLQHELLEADGRDAEDRQAKKLDPESWKTAMIEDERQRGMRVVNEGDLDQLEHDFDEGAEVLARHFDL